MISITHKHGGTQQHATIETEGWYKDMTRQRYIGKVRALADAIQYKYNGKHINGSNNKFYKNSIIGSTLKFKSYAEAWESLKPARDLVNM